MPNNEQQALPATIDTAMLADSIRRVRERVSLACERAGRRAADVQLLAATKYLDADACSKLVACGIDQLAENRLDALVPKQSALSDHPAREWHYIGRLQSRQAITIAQHVGMIHTLTTHSAARRLAQAAADERLASLPEILIQVNVDEDPAKDGIAAAQVDAFLDTLPDEIAIAGFMTMPAWAEDPEQSRTAFAQLRGLRDELSANWQGRHSLMYLSMGTSQDFAVAIEEGATHVRLGRILFSGGE